MNKDIRKNDAAFIPCGDSMEKMEEIKDEQLGQVSGGNVPVRIPPDWEDALPVEQLPDAWVQE